MRRGEKNSATFLMPDYDEYGIAYKDRSALSSLSRSTRPRDTEELVYNRMIVIDGRIEGTWRRTEATDKIVVHAVPFASFNKAQRNALTKAIARFGAFCGKKARLNVTR
jgi:hypothetical protein